MPPKRKTDDPKVTKPRRKPKLTKKGKEQCAAKKETKKKRKERELKKKAASPPARTARVRLGGISLGRGSQGTSSLPRSSEFLSSS